MMHERSFHETLIAILKSRAAQVGLKPAQIAANLNKLGAKRKGKPEHWTEHKVKSVYYSSSAEGGNRPRRKLDVEWLDEFIWAHEIAPYGAYRVVKRMLNDAPVKQAFVFDEHSFTEPSMHGIGHGKEASASVVMDLDCLPSSEAYDIMQMKLGGGRKSTGERHRRRHYHEIAICLEGEVKVSFDEPPNGDDQKEWLLKAGESLAYNAEIPHQASVPQGGTAKLRIISICLPQSAPSKSRGARQAGDDSCAAMPPAEETNRRPQGRKSAKRTNGSGGQHRRK